MNNQKDDIGKNDFDAAKNSIEQIEVKPPDFLFDNIVNELDTDNSTLTTPKTNNKMWLGGGVVLIIISILIMINIESDDKQLDSKRLPSTEVEKTNKKILPVEQKEKKLLPNEEIVPERMQVTEPNYKHEVTSEPLEKSAEPVFIYVPDSNNQNKNIDSMKIKEPEGVNNESKEEVKVQHVEQFLEDENDEGIFLGLDPTSLKDTTRAIFKSRKEMRKSKEK